jgi:hypothetical protein
MDLPEVGGDGSRVDDRDDSIVALGSFAGRSAFGR